MRSVALTGLMLLAVGLAPLRAHAGPSLVFEARSGEVLHAEDARAPWFPASLTKLMTAYVTFRALREGRIALDTRIICSAVAHGQPPSKLGLPVGASISVDLALKLLIVKSANDVAVMLAEAVAGSVEKFAAEMNATARALGMSDTHFVNPNGLPDVGQVTTARDLGLLARAIIRDFPEHDALFGLQSVRVGKRRLRSHNRLLGKFDGADGMKTGYICASGYNLVASATRGERRIVAVVLGATSGKERTDFATGLLEQGFSETWLSTLAAKKLDQLDGPSHYGSRPEHMGPVVCKRRYRESEDAYAVDARLHARTEARRRAAVAAASAAAPVARIPLIDTSAPVPLPPRRPER